MVNLASRDDFDFMALRGREIELNYAGARDWEGSSFEWLLPLPPTTRAAVARDLVEEWASALGVFDGRVRADNQIYLVMRGMRIQLKLSTRWRNGDFRFQQIRDQQYDYLLLLGVSEDDIHVWLVPKDVALSHLVGVGGQHTGAHARETYWLRVDPTLPPSWLIEYGDQLSDLRTALLRLQSVRSN